jgi:hypothetical protein
MTLPSYNTVTVTTSPTLILAANPERKGAIVYNNGSVVVYIGFDASVTTSNGLTVQPGGVLNDSGFEDAYRSNIYGVAASGTCDVRYWEWV